MTLLPLRVVACVIAAICVVPAADANDWVATGPVAHTVTVSTTDGQPASIEVDCRGSVQVRLLHDRLGDLPVDKRDPRPGWRRTVFPHVSEGWGLDLSRPDHYGSRTVWYPCETRSNCLLARDAKFTVSNLKRNWTLHIRLDLPAEAPFDIRFDLVGSKAAIDAACQSSPLSTPR